MRGIGRPDLLLQVLLDNGAQLVRHGDLATAVMLQGQDDDVSKFDLPGA